METKNLSKNAYFWWALAIVIVTIALSVATYSRWLELHSAIGPAYIHHWFTWGGALFIGIYTPSYYFLKRRYRARYNRLFNLHIFGNLIAFLLISVHFAQQMGRPAEFFPDLGTGLALYIVLTMLVVTGFLRRFQIAKAMEKYWRFIHLSVTVSFYVIIGIHILHGSEVL